MTGRIKDVMIFRGRNLYPQDIEHELRTSHPELANVGAVFTAPVHPSDPRDPEEALVVTHEVRAGLGEPRLAALATALRQTVARDFGVVPAAVLLLRRGAVRRTTSGKIERSAMRDLFTTGRLDSEYAAVITPGEPR